MLEYNGIDLSEGTDFNKTSAFICHYSCFLEKHFRIDPKVCNGCHDLMQRVMSFNEVAIVSAKKMIIKFIFII